MTLRATLLRFLFALFGFSVPAAKAIDYGKTPPPELGAVNVALARLEDESRPDPWKIFCSGVAIAPRIVLTAAHCVQEGSRRPSRDEIRRIAQQIRIAPVPGSSQGWLAEARMRVESVHIHPGYMRDFRGQNDIAILSLNESLPGPFANLVTDPVLLKTLVRKNGVLWLSGYGLSEQVSESSGRVRDFFGTLRWGPLRIDAKHASEFQVVADLLLSQRLGFAGAVAPRDGDSGGPAFFQDSQGKLSLVGLVSRSVKHNHGPYGAAITQVFDSLCWIESVSRLRLSLTNGFQEHCDDFFLKPDLKTWGTWSELCRNKLKLTSASLYTVTLLEKLLQASDCQDVEPKARALLSINLDATGLSDLGPVFLAFQNAERISARDNRVQELPLQSPPTALRFLDLSYNNIRNWQPLVDQNRAELRLVGPTRQYHSMGRTEFIKACQSGVSTPDQKKLVDALIHEFFVESGDCVSANFELLRRRSLEFYIARDLKDFSLLHGLETLERLSLLGQAPMSLDFVLNLPQLRILELESSYGLDLSGLNSHPQLQNLSLRGGVFRGFEALTKIPGLQTIELTNTTIPRTIQRDLENRGVRIVSR